MCKPTSPKVSIPTRLLNFQQVIDSPSEFDVLCGSKSTAFNNHPGNHLFRQKVQSCLAAYTNARTKQQKMKINRQIVHFMRQKFGARFLKQNKDKTWAIAEEQSIRDKVSHALRYASLQKEKEEKQGLAEMDSFDYEPVPFVSSSAPAEVPSMTSDGDSQSVMVDEVHRRQLSILGCLLSQKVREELNLDRDGDNGSLSGLSNNE